MLCLVAASSILCILDTTKLEPVQAMSVCQARSLFLRLLTPCHHVCLIKQPSIVIDFEEVKWCTYCMPVMTVTFLCVYVANARIVSPPLHGRHHETLNPKSKTQNPNVAHLQPSAPSATPCWLLEGLLWGSWTQCSGSVCARSWAMTWALIIALAPRWLQWAALLVSLS